MFKVYILFSKHLDCYYTGFTGDEITERIRRHNSNHRGFTGKSNDWTLVWLEENLTEQQARSREQEIKKWKSRKRIEKLIGKNDA